MFESTEYIPMDAVQMKYYFQNIQIILKPPLQNYKKILKKYFFDTEDISVMNSWVMNK